MGCFYLVPAVMLLVELLIAPGAVMATLAHGGGHIGALQNQGHLSWLGNYVEDSVDGMKVIVRSADPPMVEADGTRGFMTDGSILLAINGTSMDSVADFYKALAVPPGSHLHIGMWDPLQRTRTTATVTTIDAPPEVAAYMRGVLRHAAGDLQAARAAFEDTLRLADDALSRQERADDGTLYLKVQAFERLGDLALQNVDQRGAVAQYRDALRAAEPVEQRYSLRSLLDDEPELLLSARLWRKIAEAYVGMQDTDEAWNAALQSQQILERFGYYRPAITLLERLETALRLKDAQHLQLRLTLGHLHMRDGDLAAGRQHYQLAAKQADQLNDSARVLDAQASLAAIDRIEGNQAAFEAAVSRGRALAGSESAIAQFHDRVIREIVFLRLPILLGSEATGFADDERPIMTIYRLLLANVDADGQDEVLVAGGTTTDIGGVGTSLLYDWDGTRLHEHVLVNQEDSFQSLSVQDVNQDGRMDIIVVWRQEIGSSAALKPFVFSYDGGQTQTLFSYTSLTDVGFGQGALDFIDLDADGTDELLVWSSLWDVQEGEASIPIIGASALIEESRATFEDDCHWCPVVYRLAVFHWDGAQYTQQQVLRTRERFDPNEVTGRENNLFGLGIDPDRNLAIERSRTELARQRNAGETTASFVQEVTDRAFSFWTERLYAEGEQMAIIAEDAAQLLPNAEDRVSAQVNARTLRGMNLHGEGKTLQATDLYLTALDMLRSASFEHEADRQYQLVRTANMSYHAAINFRDYDLATALKYFTEATDIARQVERTDLAIDSLLDTGHTYLAFGDTERALDSFKGALDVYAQTNDPEQFSIERHQAYLGMGLTFHASGEFNTAIEYFRKSLDEAAGMGLMQSSANVYREIGRTYYDQQQYDRALAYLQRSLYLSSSESIRTTQGLIYVYLGDAYAATGQPQQAAAQYRKVLDTYGQATRVSPYGTFWRAEYGLARRALEVGDQHGALDHLQAAIDALEQERSSIPTEALATQLVNTELKVNVYRATVRLLHQLGRDDEAFHYAERARARSFLDQLANQRFGGTAARSQELLAQEERLRLELGELDRRRAAELERPLDARRPEELQVIDTEVQSKRKAYEDVLVRLQLDDPEAASLRAAAPITLTETQHLLDEETTLVSYFTTSDTVFAFVVGKHEFHIVELPRPLHALSREIPAPPAAPRAATPRRAGAPVATAAPRRLPAVPGSRAALHTAARRSGRRNRRAVRRVPSASDLAAGNSPP